MLYDGNVLPYSTISIYIIYIYILFFFFTMVGGITIGYAYGCLGATHHIQRGAYRVLVSSCFDIAKIDGMPPGLRPLGLRRIARSLFPVRNHTAMASGHHLAITIAGKEKRPLWASNGFKPPIRFPPPPLPNLTRNLRAGLRRKGAGYLIKSAL